MKYMIYESIASLLNETDNSIYNFKVKGIIKEDIIEKTRLDKTKFYQYILEDRESKLILRRDNLPEKELKNKVLVITGHITYSDNNKKGKLRKIYNINTIEIDENTTYDLYCKDIKVDLIKLMHDYTYILNEIENKEIREIVKKIIEEYEPMFSTYPGGLTIHHNYKYGLLEHSINVAKMCIKAYELYKQYYKEINKDVLIAGALLHDIGKVTCYGLDENNISLKTIQLHIFNHIANGFYMVKKFFDEKSNLSNEVKDNIYHIILSHHGDINKGSPVLPQTIEALIVSTMDGLDADINFYIDKINKLKESNNITEKQKYYHRSIWNGKYFNDNNTQILKINNK